MDEKSTAGPKKPRITEVSVKDLEARLHRFETRYGLSSEEFYRQACAGLLDEEDEYISWLGYYEAYLRLREKGQNSHHDP